jgi:hypothetical protein
VCRYQKLLGYLCFDTFSDPNTNSVHSPFPFVKTPFRLERDLPRTPTSFGNVHSTDKWHGVITRRIARKMHERRGRRCRNQGVNSKRKIELSITRL